MRHIADGSSSVQSVDRALSILELVTERPDLGVTAIADAVGLPKSTTFRLLAVLEAHELVAQVGDRGVYRPGIGIALLAGAVLARHDLVRDSHDVCRALAAELRETVNIAILDEGAAVNLTQDLGGRSVLVHNRIGRRTPLHATSSGKVLLAGSGAAEIGAVLAELTPRTITDPRALHVELDRVRRNGWGSAAGELEIGLNGVAVPIRIDGAVVGALSASGPGYRLAEESFPMVARRLAAAAAEIGGRLAARRTPARQAGTAASG